jgi:hypothetical protein
MSIDIYLIGALSGELLSVRFVDAVRFVSSELKLCFNLNLRKSHYEGLLQYF